jgi:hypothetical protein
VKVTFLVLTAASMKMTVTAMLHREESYKFIDVSEVLTVSIIMAKMVAAVSTSETWVNFYRSTRCNIPEDKSSSATKFNSTSCMCVQGRLNVTAHPGSLACTSFKINIYKDGCLLVCR